MPKRIQFNFKSPNESPGYLLGQLTMLWQRKQKKVLDPLDLTQTQFALLCAIAWLSNQNKNVTQIDIAVQTNFDRMMVSKVLRSLEAKKFVTRKEHEFDTRAKSIGLTNYGSKVLQKAIIEVEAADIDFFTTKGNNLSQFNNYLVLLIDKNTHG